MKRWLLATYISRKGGLLLSVRGLKLSPQGPPTGQVLWISLLQQRWLNQWLRLRLKQIITCSAESKSLIRKGYFHITFIYLSANIISEFQRLLL
ncbi:hypothetical protein FKM82_001926 [Ascaphus truei]